MIRDVSTEEIREQGAAAWSRWHAGADVLLLRDLGNGRAVTLMLMGFGNLRLALGPAHGMTYEQTYCYHDSREAWRSAIGWDGEDDPEGWYRHHQTARRRPDGDPSLEYILP